ncbi:serine/threonine-protein kinase [Corallococcus macrosporus]|uniref:non-specific serine/threonine protein kinase n=1 Tax=Myxococcus fulvus (strain ATCC BAA-855 / HW-1) TaxID=483219 RepID=F8CMF5_MYXFH|nr:serine/threonine-protein kinase [Corallococcus macrosporus]AEI64022.1 putative serine/threonine protein kinase [Corallococcus macrosporus]
MLFSRSQPFPRGTVLFTRKGALYELVEDLGAGPHGERLLLAHKRVKDGRAARVLLKALPLSNASAPMKEARERLEEEVRLASFLKYPNIARVHGMHKARRVLFVMTEAVPGYSLNTLLEVAFARGRTFPEPFMLYVGAQVAGALAHAHACRGPTGAPLGIVHRAIDPGRIRVGLDGQVKLMDFGLASARLPGTRATRRPGARGEVYWASPEALLGQPEDGRSDLFALGLVLLEFATGTHLLSAYRMLLQDLWALVPEGEAEALRALIDRTRGAWAGVDPEETIVRAATLSHADVVAATRPLSEPVRAIFHKLLRRAPSERYASALTLQDDLTQALRTYGSYTARTATREIQLALREAGEALAGEEEGAWGAPHEDAITTEPSPA